MRFSGCEAGAAATTRADLGLEGSGINDGHDGGGSEVGGTGGGVTRGLVD